MGGQSFGLSPEPLESVLTLISVRIKLNCKTPAGLKELVGVKTPPTPHSHLVSDLLYVGAKEKQGVFLMVLLLPPFEIEGKKKHLPLVLTRISELLYMAIRILYGWSLPSFLLIPPPLQHV